MTARQDTFKSEVLDWLKTLAVPGSHCRYRFSTTCDDTVFCACFALFLLDLFGQVEQFDDQQTQQWISYIQSFQNDEHGYFEPEVYYHQDRDRNRYQLTCFCLSALRILNAEPKIALNFISQWKTPDQVKQYLYQNGCHLGKPGSGNKAMFLAIFLTYQYQRTKEHHLLDKIDAWFQFHNKMQNRSGFWGEDKSSHFFQGVQNGFHQLLVYFYWNRTVPKLDRIVDRTLTIQDRSGYFAPTPGGEACHDYDAIHILTSAYKISTYRRDQIATSLAKAFNAILKNQNPDGGFCQSNYRPDSVIGLIKYLPCFISGTTPYCWYYRLRRSITVARAKQATIDTGWTSKGRKWDQSSLLDTWFRCLSLAQIANTIDLKDSLGLTSANFHKMIGIGFFKTDATRCQSETK